jgi:two-component system response regulator TctD
MGSSTFVNPPPLAGLAGMGKRYQPNLSSTCHGETVPNDLHWRRDKRSITRVQGRVSRIRILLVEDTQDVADAVVASFGRRGDAVDHARTRAEADDLLAVQGYDVIVLDINLPDGDGLSLLSDQRRHGDTTPILMLTARLEVDDRVAALDRGADDYLVKPFDLRELEARVRALARRSAGEPREGSLITYADLEVDLAGHTANLNGLALALTRREFSLLETLLASRGRVISKEQIFDRMFSFDETDVGMNAVETYVARLRKKLDGGKVAITTLRGLGYQLVSLE